MSRHRFAAHYVRYSGQYQRCPCVASTPITTHDVLLSARSKRCFPIYSPAVLPNGGDPGHSVTFSVQYKNADTWLRSPGPLLPEATASQFAAAQVSPFPIVHHGANPVVNCLAQPPPNASRKYLGTRPTTTADTYLGMG